MSRTSFQYSKRKSEEINIISRTLFEGIQNTTSASGLASKLGIQAADISDFIQQSDSINCNISVPYNIGGGFPTLAFKDVDGQAQQINDQGYLRSGIKVFYSTSLHTLGQRCFLGVRSLKYCIIPNVDTVIPNSFGHYIFELDGQANLNHITVCFPAAWETSNGGNPHPEAQYVIDNGGTVTFGDPENYEFLLEKPGKINNLTDAGGIGTIKDFSFTIPNSTNQIIRFEVYLDGVKVFNIGPTKNEFSLTFDSLNTNYNVKIQAVDEYYNRSDFSNEITVTTAASEPYPGLNSVYELQDSQPGVIVDVYGGNNGVILGTYSMEEANSKIKSKSIYLGRNGSIQVPNRGIKRKASFNMWMHKDFHGSIKESGLARFNNSNAQGQYIYSNGTMYIDNFCNPRKTLGGGLIADLSAAYHMLTITADQDANEWRLYQNAQLAYSGGVGNLESVIWEVFEIGTSGMAITNPADSLSFFGFAEQILFFHKALTQAEIDYWYNGGAGRIPVLT